MTHQQPDLETPSLTEKPTDIPQSTLSEGISIKAMEKTAVNTSIKLTGRMLSFTRLQIQGDDLTLIDTQLQKKLGQTRHSSQPKLPVLISCNAKLDLAKLWDLLWVSGLQPIGLVTGVMDEQAIAQKIPIFPVDGKRLSTITTPQPTIASLTDTPIANSNAQSPVTENLAMWSEDKPQSFTIGSSTDTPATSFIQGDRVYTQIVRSGQSINHVGGDLILTNSINAGAEAITDYSLHVYGKAEGRLVAGATGDSNARIFCLRFNPSLVSVAGTYCLRENIPAEFLDKAVQVSFDPQTGLVFELMSA